jgi:cardiolipin synthase A/B
MARRTRKLTLQSLGIFIILIIVAIIGSKSSLTTNNNDASTSNSQATAPAGTLSLITEPASGVTPVLNLINNAKHSVDLVMYELEDQQVETALGNAESRGVQVRVLLNGGYYGKPDKTNPNQKAYGYLQAHHVPVRWTPSYFALTHQKTLTVDSKTSLIMTFNLTPQYYATSRDFGITDTDSKDVSAVEATFNDDWQGNKVTAPSGDDLLWSPGSEVATVSLINGAKSSLKIYNEEMEDTKVVSALGAAAMRSVDVQVVMTDQSSWHKNFTKLKNDGAHIRTLHGEKPLYIHAKMVLADGKQAFIGSENFSYTSLVRNRELGLTTTDSGILSQLNTTFSSDYQNATPY